MLRCDFFLDFLGRDLSLPIFNCQYSSTCSISAQAKFAEIEYSNLDFHHPERVRILASSPSSETLSSLIRAALLHFM